MGVNTSSEGWAPGLQYLDHVSSCPLPSGCSCSGWRACSWPTVHEQQASWQLCPTLAPSLLISGALRILIPWHPLPPHPTLLTSCWLEILTVIEPGWALQFLVMTSQLRSPLCSWSLHVWNPKTPCDFCPGSPAGQALIDLGQLCQTHSFLPLLA